MASFLAGWEIARFGGRRLYIPRSPGEHHPITVAIGEAGAAQLAAAFHGAAIDVPLPPQRQALIRQLDDEGLSRADIAAKAGCTVRWVYKTLSTPENEARAREPTLFD